MKFHSHRSLQIFLTLLILVIGLNSANARTRYNTDPLDLEARKTSIDEPPFVDYGVHNIGRIGLTVTNQGQIGTGFANYAGDAPSCQYPYPSTSNYLFAGALWLGAVVGKDTLVSVAADGWSYTREMWPDPGASYPPYGGAIVARSISDNPEAISEQDYIAVFTDTLTDPSYVDNDPWDQRPHSPLNIEITQRTFAWSYSYAEDFVLFDYSIKNIGRKSLKKVYMAIYVDGDVLPNGAQEGFDDDLCGFKRSVPSTYGCGFIDTVNIAWIADNNGRQTAEDTRCIFPAVTGSRVVRTPSDSLKYSFNWWISNGNPALDWGPRMAGTQDDPFRVFGQFMGTPEGDKNKYYIMRHEEFDYDQLECAIDHTADGWMPPDQQRINFANGYDTRYLLSWGPFDIDPGEVLPISFCYVAGDNFHTEDCSQFDDIFDPFNPLPYQEHLNYEDIGINAVWASWIYDNPGFDTDGNGYRGKYRVCVFDSILSDSIINEDPLITDTFWLYTVADTVYYEGDGVPDFRGASPPPPPELWVIDTSGDTLGSKIIPRLTDENIGELEIRWNGFKSETEKDVFSNKVDFEGYRVHIGYAPIRESYTTVASYDIADFNRRTWSRSRSLWELKDTPFTLDSLQVLYGAGFDPSLYDRDNPLYWNDTAYAFSTQDWNQSDYRDTLGIHKVWPDEPSPTLTNLDSARLYYPEELTDDGLFFKYYEYAYIARNLLPSQLHYISVTAFDYGSPSTGLESLETPPERNFIAEYPQEPASVVEDKGLEVIVYPNPYRADGNYASSGFEGRDYVVYSNHSDSLIRLEHLNQDRRRGIHFINLPHKCTIRIFTIDGDMVKEIDHDAASNAPQSGHELWDMISRNTQSVASGIYYYSVESEFGSQLGKLVLIM